MLAQVVALPVSWQFTLTMLVRYCSMAAQKTCSSGVGAGSHSEMARAC